VTNRLCSMLKHPNSDLILSSEEKFRNSLCSHSHYCGAKQEVQSSKARVSITNPCMTWTQTLSSRKLNVPHMSDPHLSPHAPVPAGSASNGFQAKKTSVLVITLQKWVNRASRIVQYDKLLDLLVPCNIWKNPYSSHSLKILFYQVYWKLSWVTQIVK
jgi:hypothetical protein